MSRLPLAEQNPDGSLIGKILNKLTALAQSMGSSNSLAKHLLLCFLFIETYSHLHKTLLYWHRSLLNTIFNKLEK